MGSVIRDTNKLTHLLTAQFYKFWFKMPSAKAAAKKKAETKKNAALGVKKTTKTKKVSKKAEKKKNAKATKTAAKATKKVAKKAAKTKKAAAPKKLEISTRLKND